MGVLDGRVAVITGAGRGVGASIARAFAREGASLVINDLGTSPDGSGADAGPAQDLANELTGLGHAVVADGGDIADTATGERLVATAVETFGQLDVVVNVAGILRDRMIFNMSDEDWDSVLRVHLRGTYSTVRPAAAHFRRQRRPDGHFRIINFTSASGLHGSPGQANYAAAKMGIVGLTQSLANGLSRYGVTANAISPAARTRLVAGIPSDRSVGGTGSTPDMSPDNIAPLALFLASDRSDWLSGRVLSAGGHHVGLYDVPQEIAGLDSDGPWDIGDLFVRVEKEFRPLADGLAPSPFLTQLGG